MKHVKQISRTPKTASDTINTITGSKIDTKESMINGKASGL